MLYVRNLTQEVTENRLKESFEAYGSVERVKKIKDYAFIHFNDRSCALKVIIKHRIHHIYIMQSILFIISNNILI